MMLAPVAPHEVEKAWTKVQPFAAQIESRFKEDWPQRVTYEAALARELQLWIIWDETNREILGVVGTRIVTRPSGKRKLDIPWAAGKRREDWLHLLSQIEEYGAAEGCEEVEFTARWGWQPNLPDYACERLAIFRKALGNGKTEY